MCPPSARPSLFAIDSPARTRNAFSPLRFRLQPTSRAFPASYRFMNSRPFALVFSMLIAGLLLIGALSEFFSFGGDELAPGAEPPAETVKREELPAAELTDSAQRQAVEPETGEDDTAVQAKPEVGAGVEATVVLAHLRGRLLLPGGAPAVGADLRVRGWGAGDERRRKYGEPKDWVEPKGQTDSEGRFDIPFDPPRAYQFVLDANYPQHAELSWRWSSLPVGEVTEVGDQVFAPAGTIVGRVLNEAGSPTGIGWRVYADSSYTPKGKGADSTRVSVDADPETGEFRLEGVPPGSAQLKAYARMANWIDGPLVNVEFGTQTQADILYRGPDQASRITIRTFCDPFYVFNEPEDGSITVSSREGQTWIAKKIEGSSQSYTVDGLPPGTYTVSIESPLHRTWYKRDVSPGQSIDAHLLGSVSLLLNVFDKVTEQRIEHFGLDLRFEESNFSTSLFELHVAGRDLPRNNVFTGLLPLPATLIVKAHGYASLEVPLGHMQAGDMRRTSAQLVPGGQLPGQVQMANGAPAAGALVTLHPHYPGYDPDDIFSGPMGPERAIFTSRCREVQCDAQGRFQFEMIFPGEFDLRASLGALSVVQEKLLLDGSTHADVSLKFPAMGTIQGKLSPELPWEFEGLKVCVYPPELENPTSPFFREATGIKLESPASDGRFEIQELPAGTYVVELLVEARKIPTSFSSGGYTTPNAWKLGRVDVLPDQVTRFDFDLSPRLPGAIEIEATLNGKPAAGLVASVRCDRKGNPRETSGGSLDAEGRLQLRPLFPGEWSLQFRSLEAPWIHRVATPITLEPGGNARVNVPIVTSVGRLSLVDEASGQVLDHHRVRLGRNGPRLTTSANGQLELELVPGEYTLVNDTNLDPTREAQSVPLSWTIDGPAQTELRLPRSSD